MKNRLCFVHVGAHKTATTALQRFCTINRKKLQDHGYHYPGKLDNHYWLSAILRNNAIDSPKLLEKTKEITTEIENFDGHIILSTEGFSEHPQLPRKVERFLSGIGFPPDRCRIIFYARRQDFWLESAYKQQVTQSNIQAAYSFSDFIMEGRLTAPNYLSALRSWAKFFKKKNIQANVFERQQLPDGIFKDFCRNLQLSWSNDLNLPTEEESNVGLSLQDIELLRIINGLGISVEHHERVVRMLKKATEAQTSTNEELLSPRLRLKILKQYEKSNAMAAEEFFGRKNGRLFHDPVPTLDDPWESPHPMDLEKALQKLVKVILQLDPG